MAKTRKYFRKHEKLHKKYKKSRKNNKSHNKSHKSKWHKNKNMHKSKKYRLRGGGNFPYLPQDLVNGWWGIQHNLSKLMNNWRGTPTPPGPLPTEQPNLVKDTVIRQRLPDLSTFNEGSDLRVSNMLQ